MAEALYEYFVQSLPDELSTSLVSQLERLRNADFISIFEDPLSQHLLGHGSEDSTYDPSKPWNDFIFDQLEAILTKRGQAEVAPVVSESAVYKQHFYFILALASLGAFLQTNVTGPPLNFSPARKLLPQSVSCDAKAAKVLRGKLLEALRVDGEAPYRLTPHIELLALADTILTCPPVVKNVKAAKWARLRVDFLHQRLLGENSSTLEKDIYQNLDLVRAEVLAVDNVDLFVSFLLETATIHTHYGHDKLAKQVLQEATESRRFEYALTGLLGKRTKFQKQETSQLVVLATSAESKDASGAPHEGQIGVSMHTVKPDANLPTTLDLNDDTLLENISFSKNDSTSEPPTDTKSELSQALRNLDPENQPRLHALDSIVLLATAASITNTNPSDGLTREETLPYATRVLEGGSSNWQIYTQALLLRSRIEGYKARTVERGLLQLQALVDQVIADTGSAESSGETPTTFLPKAKDSESAFAHQRLLYVHALCSPTRWELEAELAARWVNLGGLRSALEIYERLEMWAEVALCWAGTERDDKARSIIRKQLFHSSSGNDENVDEDTETWSGAARDPPPSEAPRLYCLLGDIDKDPEMYEIAWKVSNERYSRAQRSLGRYHYGLKDYAKASLAFSKSLKVKQLDHGTWFAFGCALLELQQYKRAVEAFSRAVQLDHDDAESWSNMAAALLNLEPDEDTAIEIKEAEDDDVEEGIQEHPKPADPQKNKTDALKALKQAARLKRDNHRIWDNLLTVSASLTPPSWPDMLTAQSRLITLRSGTSGEQCIDVTLLSALANHVISTYPPSDAEKPGLPKRLVQLVDREVTPLITASAPLWRLVGKLALWRGRPSAALEASEKAWRVVVGQPGWEHGTEARWEEVVEATVELVGAYESLGQRVKTEGLGAGEALVAKDWKFKARSAVRGIKGRGKDSWEGTKGWDRLEEALEELKR